MKIIWTDFAILNLKLIFDYYVSKASKRIAHKLRTQILKSTRQLKSNPNSGQIEPYLKEINRNYHYLICGNYKILYQVMEDKVVIHDIFDTRQNPIKLGDESRLDDF